MNILSKRTNKKDKKEMSLFSWEYKVIPSYIWRIFVVSGEELYLEKTVVASSSEDAIFKAGVNAILKEKNRKPSDVVIKTIPIVDLNEESKKK